MTSSSPKDLPERKRAKGTLRESEPKFRDYPESAADFRLLADTIPTLVWRAGSDGEIEYVNKRVLEYFGAPLGEIVGWGWTERVHPDDAAFKLLEKHRDNLPELFIVSHVELHTAAPSSALTPSVRPCSELGLSRCMRCWRWVPALEGTLHGDICSRCAAIRHQSNLE